MGLEMDLSRVLRDPTCVWSAIQQWKAVCLVDSISKSLIGSKSLQRPADEVAPSAVAMGISSTDSTVPDRSTVSYPQAEQLSPQENIANALSELDRTEGATVDDIWYLAEVAEQHLSDGQSIIFVDWARYYNTFFITLFNGTDGRLRKRVIDIDYSFVESWVTENLGLFEHEDGRKTRRRLMSIASLSKLWLLIADVISFSKEGDLLILCPSGIQHSVPLHAIPIEPNGPPLITRNPIVYCASIATMAKCVKKLQERKRDGPFRAAGFARFGIEDLVEEARMEAAVREGMNHFAMSRVVSGRKLTRNTFSDCTHNIDLLHYHGHASLEISHIIRGLVFEPDPESNDSGHFSVMDIFKLNLSACIVVLLACASGEEDVAPNDDPLGLLSAFLFSGASTVIATMWPTQTADARMFTERFYRIAFSNGVDGSNGIRRSSVLYLAHVFQQAVIELIDEFDGDEPYHWAQFCLRECAV